MEVPTEPEPTAKPTSPPTTPFSQPARLTTPATPNLPPKSDSNTTNIPATPQQMGTKLSSGITPTGQATEVTNASTQEVERQVAHDQSTERNDNQVAEELWENGGSSKRDTTSIIAEQVFLSEDGPKTLAQAQELEDADEWQQAAQEEINQLKQQGTWKLVDLPEGSYWVLLGHDEETQSRWHHRALQSQARGSGRPVLALAAINRHILRLMDIKGVYLNGVLKEEIYMRQPEGFDDGSGRVFQLFKTLYSLKQSGREWNTKFNNDMISLGFTRLKADCDNLVTSCSHVNLDTNPCVYIRATESRITIVTCWVDDLLLSMEMKADMDRVLEEIQRILDAKDLGPPQLILGIEIEHLPDEYKIMLHQTAYIKSLLYRFGMEDCQPVTTPMDPNAAPKMRTTDPIDKGLYAQALGSLLYAAVCTRPDIAYALHALSQYAMDPGKEHWIAVKHVFRYLKGTTTMGLTYGGEDY
ncbi:hypothetical protein FS837_011512 [Tulasnella sp. UAMH 9824]|nr:hypothetical protein FS837_011512 [Tulasnella sp. UAMH 9824]